MREKLECSRSHQDCRQLVECILNVSDKYHGDDPVELPPKLIEALERLHDLRPGKAPPPKK